MEVFSHETGRHEQRICIRFAAKPPEQLRLTLKAHGARFRRAVAGQASCWYLPRDQVQALCVALAGHPLAAQLQAFVPAPLAIMEQVVQAGVAAPAGPETGAVEEAQDAQDADDEPGQGQPAPPPRKRQRRSPRANPGSCVACMWQLRMQIETGRYHEPVIQHDSGCGF